MGESFFKESDKVVSINWEKIEETLISEGMMPYKFEDRYLDDSIPCLDDEATT